MTESLRTRAREAAERPTIALAREIASWDQSNPGTSRIPHWAVNLAAHLMDKGWAHAAQRPSREQIAEVLWNRANRWDPAMMPFDEVCSVEREHWMKDADAVLALWDGAGS